MKKILAFTLSVVLLCVAMVLPVSAQTTEENITDSDYEFCRQAYIDYKIKLDGQCDTGYVYCCVYATSDEFYIFRASTLGLDAECCLKIGDYIFYHSSIIGNETENCVGLYVADKNGEVIFLKTAVENSILNIADFAQYLPDCYLIGDADVDGKLTIKDATALQKHIAKIEGDHILVPKWHTHLVMNMNSDEDNEINIKDATAIQKYIAGLEY